MLVICKNCGKEFDKLEREILKHPNHFCSKNCSASFNNKGKQRNPPKIRICKQCKTEYFYKRKSNSYNFCTECYSNNKIRISDYIKTLSIGEYRNKISVQGKHPSWINSHIRLFTRKWNEKLRVLPCQYCGYDKHVELCHIKPIISFPDESILGTVNGEDNILVLCPNHHWEFDNGYITLEDIPKRS